MNQKDKSAKSLQRGVTRREFMAAAATAVTAPLIARAETGGPLLDMHQHTNYVGRTDEQLVAHQAYHGVTTTVLLPGAGWMLSEVGDNASCAALQANYPNLFMRFACSDVAESRTVDVLRGNIRSDYANVFGDLSAGSGANALTRDPKFARGFVQRHTRKLIWGSDCHCLNGRGDGNEDGSCIATRSLAALKDLVPDADAYRRITYENGAALLKLKPAA